MDDLLERAQKREAKKRNAANGRFAKLNRFVDVTMRTLQPSQIAVWLYLFRSEKEGVVSESVRQIAAGTGLHRNGAHKAMKELGRMGLVETIKLAKSLKDYSTYRLHATRTDESTVTHSVTIPSHFGPSHCHTQCDIPRTPIRRMRPKGRSAQQNQTETPRPERGSEIDAGPGNRLRLVNA